MSRRMRSICSLDMKGYGADEICNPKMGIISFRITSCSPSTAGSPALVSSLKNAAILFCPRYRDSLGSSSSVETLAHAPRTTSGCHAEATLSYRRYRHDRANKERGFKQEYMVERIKGVTLGFSALNGTDPADELSIYI